MPKLKIDTSLFEPIEIEIDGTVYESKRLTRNIFLEIERLTSAVEGGNIEAGYKILELLLGEKCVKVISNLDISIVNKITKFITDNASTVGQEEKNGSTPGGKGSQ